MLGQTPSAIAPGRPAGSYSLSEVESISLFGGRVNATVPLVHIGGRGGSGFSLTASPEQSAWVTETGGGANGPGAYIAFLDANHPTLNQPVPWVKPAKLGAGFLSHRTICGNPYNPYNTDDPPTVWGTRSTALIYITGDGTEHALFDELTGGGTSYLYNSQTYVPSIERGNIFSTKDGSGLTFVSDADLGAYECNLSPNSLPGVEDFPNGYLKTNDGTVSRFVNGYPQWSRDRNGNMITFTHVNGKLTRVVDSNNRVVEINGNQISFKGTNGAPRTISLNYGSLSNNLRAGYSPGGLSPIFPSNYNPSVLSTIILPDGRYYRFFYNPYGELARMETPDGAAAEYDHGAGFTPDASIYRYEDGQIGQTFPYPFVNPNIVIYRRLLVRREYADGGSTPILKTTFGRYQLDSIYADAGSARTEQSDPVTNDVFSRQDHYFMGDPASGLLPGNYQFFTYDGTETKTESLDVSSNVVLSRIENQLGTICFVARATCGTDNIPLQWSKFVEKTTSSIYDANTSQYLVTKKEFKYDKYDNLIDTFDYDFTTSQAFSLLRHSHTDYVANTNYTSETGAHLRSLPSQSWVSADVSGSNKASLTEFEYDNYTGGNNAGLQTRADATGHDTGSYGTGTTIRGNATSIKSYADAQNLSGAVTAYAHYDILGNVVETIDSNGNHSIVNYTDNFGSSSGEARTPATISEVNGLNTYAFPTSTINALNWTTGYSQFDYYTGQTVDTEDLNGVVSTIFYNDPLERPTQTITANNLSSFKRQTTIVYDDNPATRKVTTTSDLFGFNDNLSKSESLYDGLGRTIESRRYETNTSYIATKSIPFVMVQDPDTLVWRAATQVSNPFRQNETPIWTTTLNDSLGRAYKVITPDGAEVLNSFSGNVTTVTDQAGKQRRSITNALGQLKRVDEPTSELGPVGTPNQATYYDYDALGNLKTVTQTGSTSAGQCGTGNPAPSCAQQRDFTYDSLSRLKSAANPESGLVQYTYDHNGNLKIKLDARNVTTTYDYDALNRVISKIYTNEPAGQPATPSVNYSYDGIYYDLAGAQHTATGAVKGKLTGVRSWLSITNYTEFDAVGEIKASQQNTDSTLYGFAYEYNLAGQLTLETYPSGRQVKSDYAADGDLSAVSSRTSATASLKPFAGSFTYAPHGAILKMQLGNGRWETAKYNNRLQPTQLGLGATNNPDAADLLTIAYGYNGTSNNGNVTSQVIYVPGAGGEPGFAAAQSYNYDSLNRLQSASETIGGGSPVWQQTYSYDRFGNRTFNTAGTTIPSDCQQAVCNPAISATNNRLSSPGYGYDPAGNLTNNAKAESFTYDAENHQLEFKNPAGTIVGKYHYDGDGRRVAKDALEAGVMQRTVFVYDAMGKLAAEYSTGQSSTEQTSYLTSDMLGSPRVITNQAGAVTSRRDFLPFGEDLSTPLRTIQLGYAADTVRQKFTGYEKDTESDLDFAQARYYNSKHGRFTSVDPENAGASENDPQSWNGYAYGRNNPTLLVDPSGKEYEYCDKDGTCVRYTDEQFQKYLKTLPDGFTREKGKDGAGKILLNGEEVATYTRPSVDFGSDFATGAMGETARRAPAAGNLALVTAGTSYALGAGIGGGLYLAGTVGFRALAERLATSLISRGQIARQIGKEQTKLLGKLFGSGEKGARQALANPQGVQNITTESLVMYREIARRTIVEEIAPASQALRIQIIDKILLQRGVVLPK